MSRDQAARKYRPTGNDGNASANITATGKKKPANFINADATVWARLQPIKSHALRGLLIVIAGCADRNNLQCWPSQQFLALHSGQSERTVRTQLAELVEGGFIKIEHRRDGAGQRMASLITVLIDPSDDLGTGAYPPANSEGPPAKNPAIHRQPCLPVIKEEQEKQFRTDDEGSREARSEQSPTWPSQPVERRAGRVEVDDRPRHTPAPPPPPEPKVDQFLKAYPRHDAHTASDRREAVAAFEIAVQRGVDPDLMIWAAHNYRHLTQRKGFRPQAPQWWVRKQLWNDQSGVGQFMAAAGNARERKRLMAIADGAGGFL